MPEMNFSPKLETDLRRALAVPAPNEEFVARLRTQLEHEVNTMQPETRRFSPRLAWGLSVALIVLLAIFLATSPTVVEAMKRLFGYVPGAGLVEQGSDLRVLAEPVVVERDGIVLTVTEAFASPEKTIVSYKVENIPESALARNYAEGETPPPVCYQQDYLALPDGTILSLTGSQGGSWFLGYEMRAAFEALPADADLVDLLVACLMGTSPGKAPENWIVPLAFVPAPPDMMVMPVIEINPSAEPSPEFGVEPASASIPNPISLERVIELDDGYILIGSLHSITDENGLVTAPFAWNLHLVDASGQDIPYDYAEDVELSAGDRRSQPWAYKITGKAQAWPLSITLDAMEAVLPEHEASFEFDTGPDPQTGQEWVLNQDVRVGDYNVSVLNVTRTPEGYAFSFQADPSVVGVTVSIRGFDTAPLGGGGGGGYGPGYLSSSVAYAGQVPQGKMTVGLDSVSILVRGPWSLPWQPENAVQVATSTPSSGPAACITDESWAQIKASVPAQIPAALTGNFFLLGQKENSEIYGIRYYDLATQSNKFLAEAYWPVASPDGSKVVFTTEFGLAIHDMATAETFTVPNTDGYDYRTLWSPDGARLAFIRSKDKLYQIMVINTDGTGLQQVADLSVVFHLLVGWADNTHLFITQPVQEGVVIQSLGLLDGKVQDQLGIMLSSNKANAVLSPDGQWLAYTSSRGGNGMLGNGLYVAELDGSRQRMLAAIDGLALYFPVWSPDGKWMIISIPDPDDNGPAAQALIELDTCQVTPLPDLGGEIYSWGAAIP